MGSDRHLEYGPQRAGQPLAERVWEIRDRSPISAVGFVFGRSAGSMVEALRVEITDRRFVLGGRAVRLRTPLRALLSRGSSLPFPRRAMNVLWKGYAERCIEAPVAKEFLEAGPRGSFLEVGNVLSYYYRLPAHDIVDRYEPAPGVLNEDILGFTPGKRYEVVLSISTLEHVGFDEVEPDPGAFLRAVRHLETLRAAGGRSMFTVPLGYNPAVDEAFGDGSLAEYHLHVADRDSVSSHDWFEVPLAPALEHRRGVVFAFRGVWRCPCGGYPPHG